jgi:phytanoyl-CoA hydroxylase
MPAGSTFKGRPNALPPSYLRTLSVGDVLDNEAQNPLLYGGDG